MTMHAQALLLAPVFMSILHLSSSQYHSPEYDYDAWNQYWASQGYQPYYPSYHENTYHPPTLEDDYYAYYPYADPNTQYSPYAYPPYYPYPAEQEKDMFQESSWSEMTQFMMQSPFLVDATWQGIDLPGMGDVYESLLDN